MSITFPDGSIKRTSSNGEENIEFTDGTVVKVFPNGDKFVSLPDGEKEEHTREYRKRIMPDGTERILHKDGRVETRYKDGRAKVKNNAGVVIEDTLKAAREKMGKSKMESDT